MIATFADEPYRSPFSGNVIELCPVGALTSTQYRFEARPWEIQNVPTVCGLCPVGCNISATTREGKVKRILSRNHPEVDGGWLCDKGRFAFPHLEASDRLTRPAQREGLRRFAPLDWDAALDKAETMLRAAGSTTVTVLSGTETVEQAYALAALLRRGLGAHGALLPEPIPDALDALRAPLSAIASAEVVVVLCDEPVAERAPVVDLWIKAARRAGASVLSELPEGPLDRVVLVTDDAEHAAWFARDLGAEAAFYLPRTPNGRGVSDAWSCAADGEPVEGEPGLLVISGDEAATDPSVRTLAERAKAVIGIGMFEDSFRGFCDLVLPATGALERDGTTVNLEGRLQRQRRAVIAPCPDELAWISKLAARFEVTLSPHAPAVFDELSAICFGGISFADVGEQSTLPARPQTLAAVPVPPARTLPEGSGLRLLRYRPLFSGPAVERTRELAFQQPGREVELAPGDARARAVSGGDEVTVSSNGTSVRLRARLNRELPAGTVRIPRGVADELHDFVEVTA